jgi:hypothetical protein
MGMSIWTAQGRAAFISSVIDLGTFNPDEMALDRANGDIYLTGFASGGTTDSVAKVSSGSLVTLYSPLPATTGGNLQYTNGFAVDATNAWWNNGNAGPSNATEFSRAPKTGAGPITRNSPGDDFDSLSFSGTTLYAAHYLGGLYTVDGSGNVSFIGNHRTTSHLAIAGDASKLYVVDDGGAYRRNADGTFTDLVTAANTYRTNGSRLAVDSNYLYALDRSSLNGFWRIPLSGGAGTFITDASFVNLRSIGVSNGLVYVADTGEISGANQSGHVWQVDVPEPASAMPLVSLVLLTMRSTSRISRHRRERQQ